MKSLPVMIFHQGNQKYLKRVLLQAEKWNENVWLLGDESNRSFTKQWVDSHELKSDLFEKFLEVYEHMSTRPQKVEMFCFESHFKYYAFAIQMGWDEFITMDSDVMVFNKFTNNDFMDIDAAFGWTNKETDDLVLPCDPFVSYWTIDSMKEFLQFSIDLYINHIELLKNKWEYHVHNKINGGVCDMTLLGLWNSQTLRNTFNLASEYKGSTFDIQIGVADNGKPNEYCFSPTKGVKQIEFNRGVPYLTSKDGKKVRANVLHCVGHSKKYIPLLQKESNCGFAYAFVYWVTCFKVKLKCALRSLKKSCIRD